MGLLLGARRGEAGSDHEARRALALLRRIVELRMEGYQVHEIAEVTGRSLRTIERTLQNCRKQLAAILSDHEPIPCEHDAEPVGYVVG